MFVRDLFGFGLRRPVIALRVLGRNDAKIHIYYYFHNMLIVLTYHTLCLNISIIFGIIYFEAVFEKTNGIPTVIHLI